jgi:flavin reductase (DIM6/NTAB) family NADH-FMN oxidoreductase RutF
MFIPQDVAISARHHFYEMGQDHGLRHDPLLAIVGPRPIGWISTLDTAGRPNLAPFSFFNLLCREPPLIGFAPNGGKDSRVNAEATGEFVWNLATRPLAKAMNISSAEASAEVDEFVLAGLTPVPSLKVAPPRVSESPVALECKVSQIVPLTDMDGREAKAGLVIGQIVAVHISHDLIADGVYDTAGAQPILRGGGRGDYFEILRDGFFHMPRPDS